MNLTDGCPACGLEEGPIKAGRVRWWFCRKHRLRWCDPTIPAGNSGLDERRAFEPIRDYTDVTLDALEDLSGFL